MKEIVVNDTNIFIDLYKVNLLDALFASPLDVHTVDFVISELKDATQLESVVSFFNKGVLTVHSFDFEDVVSIVDLMEKAGGNVSLTDCAAWYYAKENDYILITGDRQLRNKAIASNVRVRGILFLFDTFVEENILSPNQAAEKLESLLRVNPRLPRNEIEKRIEMWSRNDNKK